MLLGSGVEVRGKVELKHKTVKICISSSLISPQSHVHPVRVRYDSEAISVVARVRLGVMKRILKLELLHQAGHEDEESVPGQALPHADSATNTIGYKLFMSENLETSVRVLQEPLRSEHLRFTPHISVLHEAPEIGHGETVFRNGAVLHLTLFSDSNRSKYVYDEKFYIKSLNF